MLTKRYIKKCFAPWIVMPAKAHYCPVKESDIAVLANRDFVNYHYGIELARRDAIYRVSQRHVLNMINRIVANHAHRPLQ